MRVIAEGKENVTKLLGKQRVQQTEYRMMKYVLRTECEDGILLHNSITGQLILLNSYEQELLKRLPSMHEDGMNQLIENYFLVPNEYNEIDTVDKLRLLMKKVFTPKGINDYTIFTTTDCNARCFYCYQSDYPHISMNEDTCKAVVDFMECQKGKGPIAISWFGGEPLVGIKSIDRISDDLNRRGIEFSSSMISNGLLFTDDVIERALTNWHLRTVQITLDGTENVYNKTKAYVSVKGSPFKQVIKNIELLLNRGIRVNLRLNLDQHNRDDLEKLIDELLNLFLGKGNLGIYVRILYEDTGFAPIARDKDIRKALYEAQVELNERIIESKMAKLNIMLPHLNVNSCMADNSNAMVVFPDGQLFRCEHIEKQDAIGNVLTGIKGQSAYQKFQVTSENEDCLICPIRPACMILKHCEGVKDRNPITCGYDIKMRTASISKQYELYKSHSAEYSENLTNITLDFPEEIEYN